MIEKHDLELNTLKQQNVTAMEEKVQELTRKATQEQQVQNEMATSEINTVTTQLEQQHLTFIEKLKRDHYLELQSKSENQEETLQREKRELMETKRLAKIASETSKRERAESREEHELVLNTQINQLNLKHSNNVIQTIQKKEKEWLNNKEMEINALKLQHEKDIQQKALETAAETAARVSKAAKSKSQAAAKATAKERWKMLTKHSTVRSKSKSVDLSVLINLHHTSCNYYYNTFS